jgi:peptidoglycan/LPS O-acetylase OafA/YrhL
MEPQKARRTFQTLDGLRGVGAFLVVTRHVPYFFGPIRAPESFLAVDLFYLVSGLVVANAYGQRLRDGGFFWTFMKTRLIRLYPLYLFGLALGVAAALVSVIGDPKGWWTWPKLTEAIAFGLFMVPTVPGMAAPGTALDGPIWTLLPELIANAVYAALVRFMTLPVLIAIMVVCGAGLVFGEFHYGTLDIGYNPTDQWAALARVGFSFFTGVLLFRFIGDKEHRAEWLAWACLAVLAFLLAYTPSDAVGPWYELGVVLIGFPVLIVLAARFEPGPFTGRLFSFIGLMSYGVYLVHQPLGNLARDALKHVVVVPRDIRGVAFGAVFLALTIGLAWWLDRFYDAPARRLLRRWFLAEAK